MPTDEPATAPIALLILTRDPAGRMTGRKTVIATAVRSLESAGMQVEVVVLSRAAPEPLWEGRPVHHTPLPSLPRTAATALGVLIRRRGTLNEALFDSPRSRRRTVAVARVRDAKLVVADGLRTSGPAMATDLPVLVHLDDLLSERYAALRQGTGAVTDVLGFFSEQVPAPLRRPAQWLAQRVLRLESHLAGKREDELARTADAVAMTSADEARRLAARTGRSVLALPMAVDVRAAGDPERVEPTSVVFLGLLDYAPNLAALRWWCDAVRPHLDALGGQEVQLTVIGHRKSSAALADGRVHFTGYVEDLGVELRRHRAMVVPVLSGAGVKTKVLDGWSVGLPVVATPAGAAGLSSSPGLLLAADAPDFAVSVMRLVRDGGLAKRTGEAGREALRRDWSSAALARRWQEAVAPLLR